MDIPITFQVMVYGKLEPYNEVLSKARCRIFYKYANRNGAYITDQFAEQLIKSLPYVPVKGIYDNFNNDYTDHGKNRDEGRIYGIVPETYNFAWEKHLDEDGIEREFLTCEGILWSKFDDSTEIFMRDECKDQSMEIDNFVGTFNKYQQFECSSFRFTGLCCLGCGVEPAMYGACVDINFSIDEIKTKLELFNSYFSKQSQPSNDDDINNNDTKGGEKLTTEMIDSIFAEFNLTRDDIDFEITDDMTEETLREKLEFACGDKKKKKFEAILAEFNVTFEELGEYDADITEDDFRKLVSDFAENRDKTTGTEPDVTPEPKATFSTYNQKYDLLRGALPRKEERDEDKLTYCLEYWVCDFDDNFVYVSKEEYKDDQWSYSKGRFAYSIVDDVVSITSDFEEMVVKWVTPEEETEIDKARAAFSKIEEFEANMAEFERLKQFEKSKIEEEFTSAANAIFSKFDETLKDVDGYDILKTSFSDMSLDTIEEKCYAMLGKKNANFSVQNNTPNVVNLGVDNSNDEPEDDGYGGILSRKYHE